jgi:hypothetical protein
VELAVQAVAVLAALWEVKGLQTKALLVEMVEVLETTILRRLSLAVEAVLEKLAARTPLALVGTVLPQQLPALLLCAAAAVADRAVVAWAIAQVGTVVAVTVVQITEITLE